jgi:hypothetical protein
MQGKIPPYRFDFERTSIISAKESARKPRVSARTASDFRSENEFSPQSATDAGFLPKSDQILRPDRLTDCIVINTVCEKYSMHPQS